MNERAVLEFIRQCGPVSRAQIARERGLSKPTVSQALAALERAGLVREAGRSSGGKGPSAVLYQLNPTAGWVVGIDVGRSWVRAAIANLTGDVVARRAERAQVGSARSSAEQIGAVAHGLAGEAGIRWSKVTFTVVGSPGVFQPALDQVTPAPHPSGWDRRELVETVQEELGAKTAFENHINLATFGEQWNGLGKGVANFVYLHVGTGVGLGLVLNGQLFRGATGVAGEVAYLPLVAPDPHDPANRRHGALGSALGAKGIVALARSRGMSSPLTARKVFAAARSGDPVASSVVAVAAERIALAIAAIVSVVDPELVILGGGVGRNGDLLLEPVERELRTLSPFHPRIDVSALAEDAEVTGAVAMALRAAQERLFSRLPKEAVS